ncbi:MAG TPA: thioredoxin TrxC [Caldimonas sp.]
MLIVCTHCHAPNRVPPARAGEDPVCGKCKAPLLDGRPVELNDANLDLVTAKTEIPIVVDFWAAWCGPCKMMAPHFAQAAERLKGRVLFAKVNSDENPSTAGRFAIRSLPTLLMLRGGSEVKRQPGAIQTAQIVAWAEAGAAS